jgi:hypothetical protein
LRLRLQKKKFASDGKRVKLYQFRPAAGETEKAV